MIFKYRISTNIDQREIFSNRYLKIMYEQAKFINVNDERLSNKYQVI